MAEVHTTISGPKNEVTVVFHQPGQHPLPAGAGQPVTKTGAAISGQVNANSSTPGPVFQNPA